MEIDTSKYFNEAMKEINLDRTEPEQLNVPPFKEPTPEAKETEEYYYDEEDLPETLAKDFSYQIKNRGEDYYYEGNVKSVYKTGNKYVAKVKGGNEKPYDVSITVIDEDTATYECTCPCTYPCKHEYAVLMAISENEYSELELKPNVKEREINIKNIIQEIPAEELKAYLLSPSTVDTVIFPTESFTEYFRKYFPKQKYEFYYNNLYNELALDGNYRSKINTYIDRARQYLSGDDFDEVFKIVKSIIEAYNDTNRLNFDDYVFEVVNKLGMILRITYRKATGETKQEIKEWADKLSANTFYNNYYLEDLILSLSNGR